MKTIYISDVLNKRIIDKCAICCWLAEKRIHKNIGFFDIYDSTGEMQVIVKSEVTKDFEKAIETTKESAIELKLCFEDNEYIVEEVKVRAHAETDVIFPSPNDSKFDVFDNKNSRQFVEHPTFYIRNREIANVYYIKNLFRREIQNYFWNKKFVEMEVPTLTRQTLYDDSGAIWIDDESKISLSRCATFHLEPALMAYEKVFTLTNSHADEKVKDNRHLIEYTHLKAEICWTNLEELMEFASKMYYEIINNMYINNKERFHKLVSENDMIDRLERLKSENHIVITYDEAVDLLQRNGGDIEYGKSLSSNDEKELTRLLGEKFVWIKYIPAGVEGFMFKRKPGNPFLTQTADLIAPFGFGEIMGCAEKMTDYDELINSMKEKNKYKDMERYEDYALLRKYGIPEHGGIGMGVERAIRYVLGISHVKYLKPFPVIKKTQINH